MPVTIAVFLCERNRLLHPTTLLFSQPGSIVLWEYYLVWELNMAYVSTLRGRR